MYMLIYCTHAHTHTTHTNIQAQSKCTGWLHAKNALEGIFGEREDRNRPDRWWQALLAADMLLCRLNAYFTSCWHASVQVECMSKAFFASGKVGIDLSAYKNFCTAWEYICNIYVYIHAIGLCLGILQYVCNTPGASVAAAEQLVQKCMLLVQKYLTGLCLCLKQTKSSTLNYYYEGISVPYRYFGCKGLKGFSVICWFWGVGVLILRVLYRWPTVPVCIGDRKKKKTPCMCKILFYYVIKQKNSFNTLLVSWAYKEEDMYSLKWLVIGRN